MHIHAIVDVLTDMSLALPYAAWMLMPMSSICFIHWVFCRSGSVESEGVKMSSPWGKLWVASQALTSRCCMSGRAVR